MADERWTNGKIIVDVLPEAPRPLPLEGFSATPNPTADQLVQWYAAQGWRVATAQDLADAATAAEAARLQAIADADAQAIANAAAALAFKESMALDAGDTLLAKVLVAVVNERLPADKQITKAECVAKAREILGL